MPMPAAVWCLPLPLLPLPLARLAVVRAWLSLEEPLLLEAARRALALGLRDVPLRLLREDPEARLLPLRELPDEPELALWLLGDDPDAFAALLREEPDELRPPDVLRLLRDELDPLDDALALRLLLEDPCALLDDARPRLELPRSLATDMVHLPDAGR